MRAVLLLAAAALLLLPAANADFVCLKTDRHGNQRPVTDSNCSLVYAECFIYTGGEARVVAGVDTIGGSTCPGNILPPLSP